MGFFRPIFSFRLFSILVVMLFRYNKFFINHHKRVKLRMPFSYSMLKVNLNKLAEQNSRRKNKSKWKNKVKHNKESLNWRKITQKPQIKPNKININRLFHKSQLKYKIKWNNSLMQSFQTRLQDKLTKQKILLNTLPQ